MIIVYFRLNIRTCCFGVSGLDEAKSNYLREQRGSVPVFLGFHIRLKNSLNTGQMMYKLKSDSPQTRLRGALAGTDQPGKALK